MRLCDLSVGRVLAVGEVSGAVDASAAQQIPTAFLVLGVRPGYVVPTVQLYHRMTTFAPRMGLPATQWDGNSYAFSGDTFAGGIPTVVGWDPGWYTELGDVRVPSDVAMSEALSADPNALLVGPYHANEVGTEEVNVRHCCYLPPPYVKHAIGGDLTPRMALERIVGAVVQDGKEEVCRPLINWLKVAMTRGTLGGSSDLATDSPTAPLMDTVLREHRHNTMLADVPSLRHNGGIQDAGIAQELGALVGLQQDAATERRALVEERRLQKAALENKPPSDYFGGQIQNILRLTNVANEADLPAIWGELSNAPAKRHRGIIQKHVNEASDNLAGSLPLIVTPSHVKKVAALEFRMTNRESLETGMHPFIFNQHTEAEQERASEVAATYDFLTSQHASAGLGDAQILLNADNLALPQLFSHARGMIQRCMVWYSVFLGESHPLVQGHQIFLHDMLTGEATYEIIIPTNIRMIRYVPTLFVRWFQLRMTNWLNRQWISPQKISVPMFEDLFERIAVGDAWEPRLPLQYARIVGLGERGQIPELDLAPPAAPQGSGGNEPRREERQGGAGGPPRNNHRAEDRMVRNPEWKMELFREFHMLDARVRQVLANATAPPPVCPRDPGSVMCVAFHVKGMCNERCGRRADHLPHTDAEDQPLLAWCREHYRVA